MPEIPENIKKELPEDFDKFGRLLKLATFKRMIMSRIFPSPANINRVILKQHPSW